MGRTVPDAYRRLEWAKQLVQKLSMGEIDVKTITFSDEKRFLIDTPKMHKYYWRKEGSGRELCSKTMFLPLSGQVLDSMEQTLYTSLNQVLMHNNM